MPMIWQWFLIDIIIDDLFNLNIMTVTNIDDGEIIAVNLERKSTNKRQNNQ